MDYRVETLGLTGSVTAILRDVIHERLGLFYETHQFDHVADRLAPRVVARGFHSFMDYYYLLRYSEDPAEWLEVMNALAVHETYFWREIDQLKAVVDHVVPALNERWPGQPLRIWSVPCATGEEPLTIAMLLSEAGWFDRADFELVGSDASLEAIRRAQRGLYPERSFRNLPAALREKYFSREREGWRAAPSLHERISYDVVNLMDSRQTSRYVTAPVVFCRNVFIYFSDQSIRRVVESFERSMPAPGYLCVGAAESLLRRTNVFDLQEIGGAFMYVKGKDVDSGAPDLPVLASRERAS